MASLYCICTCVCRWSQFSQHIATFFNILSTLAKYSNRYNRLCKNRRNVWSIRAIVNWTFWHFNPKRDIRRPSKLKTVEILTKTFLRKKLCPRFCVYTFKYCMTARSSYLSFLVPCLVQPFLKFRRKATKGSNIFYSFMTSNSAILSPG